MKEWAPFENITLAAGPKGETWTLKSFEYESNGNIRAPPFWWRLRKAWGLLVGRYRPVAVLTFVVKDGVWEDDEGE